MSTGETEPHLKLSVTELVKFSAREGDLFNDDQIGPDAQDGMRGHKELQESRSAPWEKEQHVSAHFDIDGAKIQLSGRIDLLNPKNDAIIIEEIKTCFGAGHLQPNERKALHWAQLKVYAALYCLAQEKDDQQTVFSLHLSYYDLLSKQVSQERETIQAYQAINYCRKLLFIYWQWWQQVEIATQAAREKAAALQFPFNNYRPGQRDMAVGVFRTLRDGKNSLIEAPTGTGKTLSVLFPTLKAFGEKHIRQVLYLTAKGSTQHNALAALEQMQIAAKIPILVLQAKDKACPCLSTDNPARNSCRSERGICSRTLGFYDRLPEAREAALQIRYLGVNQLRALAEDFQLCPFALAIHLVPWFSVVIADVNYYFDPLVRLACFDMGSKERAVLVDEIHNLPARALDMYSAELSGELMQTVKAQLPKQAKPLTAQLDRLLSAIQHIQGCDIADQRIPTEILFSIELILRALQQTGDNGFAGGVLDTIPAYRQWVKQLYRFMAIANLQSDVHHLLLESRKENTQLKIRCLDASTFLQALYRKCRSCIGFSATLRPIEFSLQQLGMPNNTETQRLCSWFPAENQLTLCCEYISTQWQQREDNLDPLVDLIEVFISTKPGNYLVFFPSYRYLSMTYARYRERNSKSTIIVQEADANETERAAFVKAFIEQETALLGFAIAGGMFAEGIDYPGRALDGVMIIGTCMPQPSDEQQLIAEHYRRKGLNAYQYAYQFPGFIRLQQTAGRVIRSETDRGVVLFVEPRLNRPDYRALMPDNWNTQYCKSQGEIENQLRQFWETGVP